MYTHSPIYAVDTFREKSFEKDYEPVPKYLIGSNVNTA